MSTIVPEKKRLAIDKEIARLKADGAIKKILDDSLKELGVRACGRGNPPKIGSQDLGPLLVAVLGPLVVFVVLALITGLCLEWLPLPDRRHIE